MQWLDSCHPQKNVNSFFEWGTLQRRCPPPRSPTRDPWWTASGTPTLRDELCDQINPHVMPTPIWGNRFSAFVRAAANFSTSPGLRPGMGPLGGKKSQSKTDTLELNCSKYNEFLGASTFQLPSQRFTLPFGFTRTHFIKFLWVRHRLAESTLRTRVANLIHTVVTAS